MAGGDVLRAELAGPIEEAAKFEVLVAHHAWIGRSASLVFGGEILNDPVLEFRRLVDEIIGDAQLMADRPGIGDGLRTAAFVLGARHAVLGPELEGNADDVVALLEQKRRGRGGIDSTAHSDNDACFCLSHNMKGNLRWRPGGVKWIDGER